MRILLLTTAVWAFGLAVWTTAAEAQSTAGQSYKSRTYQENRSDSSQSSSASRAFPTKR